MIIVQYKWSEVVDRKIQIMKIERGQLQLVWGGGNNDMIIIMQMIFIWRGVNYNWSEVVEGSHSLCHVAAQHLQLAAFYVLKQLVLCNITISMMIIIDNHSILSGNCSHQSHNVSLMQNDDVTCKLMDENNDNDDSYNRWQWWLNLCPEVS